MAKLPETNEPFGYYVTGNDGKKVRVHRTWSDEQVEDMLKRVLKITEYLEPAADLRQAVFAAALQLSGQFVVPQSQIAVPQLVPRPNGT